VGIDVIQMCRGGRWAVSLFEDEYGLFFFANVEEDAVKAAKYLALLPAVPYSPRAHPRLIAVSA
jgi:hypothetical protein